MRRPAPEHERQIEPTPDREVGTRSCPLTWDDERIASVRRAFESDGAAGASVGVPSGRLMLKHIIPNAIFPTLVLASLAIGDVVLSFAALSFLGIGTEIGYADWGQVLSFARNWITSLNQYWYIILWPGLTLVLFVMGWNLVGDALRDVLDPRMRGKT